MTMPTEHQPEPTTAPRRPLVVDLAIAVAVIAVVVGIVAVLVRGMVGPQPESTLAPDRVQPVATATVTTAGVATTSVPAGVPTGTAQTAAPTPTTGSGTGTSQPVGTAPVGGNAVATPRPGTSTAGEPPAAAIVPTVESPGGGRPMAVATVEPLPAAVDPTIAAQVINAYLRYWDVRVQAMADPASTELNLESVMTGEELAGARKTLSDFASQGRAYETEVDHRLTITSVEGEQAVVLDELVMKSQRIDPTTGAVVVGSSPSVERQSTLFTLRSEAGSWKVAREEAAD